MRDKQKRKENGKEMDHRDEREGGLHEHTHTHKLVRWVQKTGVQRIGKDTQTHMKAGGRGTRLREGRESVRKRAKEWGSLGGEEGKGGMEEMEGNGITDQHGSVAKVRTHQHLAPLTHTSFPHWLAGCEHIRIETKRYNT